MLSYEPIFVFVLQDISSVAIEGLPLLCSSSITWFIRIQRALYNFSFVYIISEAYSGIWLSNWLIPFKSKFFFIYNPASYFYLLFLLIFILIYFLLFYYIIFLSYFFIKFFILLYLYIFILFYLLYVLCNFIVLYYLIKFLLFLLYYIPFLFISSDLFYFIIF